MRCHLFSLKATLLFVTLLQIHAECMGSSGDHSALRAAAPRSFVMCGNYSSLFMYTLTVAVGMPPVVFDVSFDTGRFAHDISFSPMQLRFTQHG
jgi:hypothetical protein